MRKVEVALKVAASLGECPRWDEQQALLYWVDINAFQLHKFDPGSGRDEYLQFEEEIGCFCLRPDDKGFVLAMRSGFYFMDNWSTELRAIADPESELEHNRFNDGRCDAAGRFIAGSVYPPKDRNGANLWSLGLGLNVRQLIDGLLTSNGAAFSPDNKTFYFSDTPKHAIYRYDYDLSTGEISKGDVFHQFEYGSGRPDGAAVDSEGYYWTALYEGQRIVRLSPLGLVVEEIAIPAKCPTMVAFGDEDLKTLYITSVANRPAEELEQFPDSGSIFKVRVDVPGMIEHRFQS
ncbi:Sugar lactone lactonase YvrE [Alteromonadaceae bacterium Bs31]|nr:Sugar lactone lactonase YvrE [Alteromonadaceae bacterium Bs31]